ncbi:MAG: ABC transporter ATP-binding protein/permease [Hyphomicrobiales bacterium]|nr:ABC transporter ATP-binding protein/permease [Hyphomicrobiales bacterium]MBV9433473.1 ABC transporter ATP-binding protein/permease [Hyphomicrobiales bacterium]
MTAIADKAQTVTERLLDISTAGVWPQFVSLLRGVKRAPERWVLLSFPILATLVIGAIAAGQVRLNAWQGALYDALQRYDLGGFVHQIVVFLTIVSLLLCLVVAQTWLTEVSKVKLRAWLTRDLLDEWLRRKHAYLLAFAGPDGVNPDQRIQEDARHLSELSADLGGGLAQATLLLLSFIGVLWVLSAQVVFNFQDRQFTIPGYMVWCALAYAAAGSWLTWMVGRPLIELNASHYAREAEFRVALVRVVEHAEAISLYRGEEDERASLDTLLASVLSVTRNLAGGVARLTWITSGHGWIAIVFPFLMAAPGYFSGKLTLGALVVVVGAFNQVQSSLRWFVDNFSRIADWRATLFRVVAIRETLRSLDTLHGAQGRIEFSDNTENKLVLDGVETFMPDSMDDCAFLDEAKVEIVPGDHVLVVGETASDKTTFFLAMAGLWSWGRGKISLPPRSEMMFLPQQPYLPTGLLCDAIAYPANSKDFSEEALRAVLKRLGLEHLIDELDRRASWDRHLSLDEQQALSFARVLLHAPRWVLLDDALGAVEPEKRERLVEIFRKELAGSAVISTGRANSREDFYGKVLHLRRCPRAERVTAGSSAARPDLVKG